MKSVADLGMDEKLEDHIFDWGADSRCPDSVQWAAFFSDSPHEILPVESGHRITLTYNLSVTPESVSATSAVSESTLLPGLSADSMALHSVLRAALADLDFMPAGGILGFGCLHAYPHTQEGLCKHVPSMLKGGDAAVQAVALGLGLQVSVKAVYDVKAQFKYLDDDEGAEYEEDEADPAEGNMMVRLCKLSAVKGLDWCMNTYGGGEYTRKDVIKNCIPRSTDDRNVTWCRPPSRWALQLVHTAHGNELSMKEWYSAAAVMVTVPKWGDSFRLPL